MIFLLVLYVCDSSLVKFASVAALEGFVKEPFLPCDADDDDDVVILGACFGINCLSFLYFGVDNRCNCSSVITNFLYGYSESWTVFSMLGR